MKIEQLIESGISAEELGAKIAQRMDEMEGMVIGYQPTGGHQVNIKLTPHFRDRHVYVIGKSGSGKTNLLRTMILQDLFEGNGLGIIAPEQEMITDEILP